MTIKITDKHCHASEHSTQLEQYLPQLKTACGDSNCAVLDLACGQGRNGLFVAKQNLPVVFADKSTNALAIIKPALTQNSRLWQIDFELTNSTPLHNQHFAAILVFRYLHRPLFDAIKKAIVPGGVIIYETFTVEQASLGRPKNPDFLLNKGELADIFSDWETLHYFEGIDNGCAVARIVAVKPMDYTTLAIS